MEDSYGIRQASCQSRRRDRHHHDELSQNLNSVDDAMAEQLIAALQMMESDPEVRVIVLEGGEKAFSAGGDIGYFYSKVQSGAEINIDPLIGKVGILAVAMKKCAKMIICSVNGAAAGAGANIALSGDLSSPPTTRSSYRRLSSWGWCRTPAALSSWAAPWVPPKPWNTARWENP
jgi:hypothetical protein